MSLFRRNKKTTRVQRIEISISDESKAKLAAIDSDVQALSGLLSDVIEEMRAIVSTLSTEIIQQVPTYTEEEYERGEGVLVFQGEKPKESPYVPGVIKDPGEYGDGLRDSPFTRVPRSTQVEWLKQIMADGEWYSAIVIAKEYAVDERHLRYMRHAVQGRLREMTEDGITEMRKSSTRGALYDYRLRSK